MILRVVALALCIASVLTLVACNSGNTEIESTIDLTAEGKKDSLELLNGFFEETLKDPDIVVSYKSGDVLQYTEHIKGTTSNVRGEDGLHIYTFVKDGKYYYAYENEDMHYSEEGKQNYDNNYCYFLSNIKLMDLMPEDSGTFQCASHVKQKEIIGKDEQKTESSAELTFDYVAEGGTIKITAKAQNGLVQSVAIESVDKETPANNRNITMAFVYGSAIVMVPDIEGWENEDNNEIAINSRDEFFFQTLYADNVIVRAEREENSFTETIANGVDYVAYVAGNKSYAFMTGDDEYVYATVDGEEKSYYIGEEMYDTGCNVYYNMNISLYDLFKTMETVSFTCTVEQDENGENGTMVYTIWNTGEVFAVINATKVNGFVTEATITSGDIVQTFSFEYDTAEVTAPDISDWYCNNPPASSEN
ncbi:MAG: hypothetical protein KIG36_04915 [Eubacteriales bacterium]|nr:hypothetical protein [Eubacteriales bacterium]